MDNDGGKRQAAQDPKATAPSSPGASAPGKVADAGASAWKALPVDAKKESKHPVAEAKEISPKERKAAERKAAAEAKARAKAQKQAEKLAKKAEKQADKQAGKQAKKNGEPVPDVAFVVEPVDGAAPEGGPEPELEAHHRQGLRLGEHAQPDFMARLKAMFTKNKDGAEAAPVQPARGKAPKPEEPVIEPNDRYKEIETYPIHPPYASVRMLYDDEMKEYIYQVLEPALTQTEKEILDFIQTTLVDTLTVAPEDLDDIDELEFITDRFNDVIFDYSIILHEDEKEEAEIKKKLLYYIRRDFIGQGPIDVMMSDPFIEDISCDGPFTPIFLYHRKYESVRSTVRFGTHEHLDGFVIKMAQRAGKHISIAEPILDATMTDGSRLQSTLAKEVSAGGSTFTIRKFRPDPFTPPDLVMFRTMSAEMLSYLWISVQSGASIMYAGGTASGKTTSLNAILLFIPPQMKIVSIEDTREVNLPHENWIAGITRHGFGPRDQFGRQAGEIDMFQLLKNALRQRPEYIIVGEVRGQEAYSLFQAMATGHAAYGTMHADSVDAVIHRLESDPIKIPRSLLEALDIVSVQIQTRVDGKRVRRTKQISEIVGLDPHTREILTNEVFSWVPTDDSFRFSGVSYVLERIQMEKGLPAGSMLKELKRRAEIISWMIDRHIQDYREVSKVVSAYYKEPELIMALVRGTLEPEAIPSGLQDIATRTGRRTDSTKAAVSAAMLASMPGADAIAKGAPAKAQPKPAEKAAPTEAAHQWPGAKALLEAAEAEAKPEAAANVAVANPAAAAAAPQSPSAPQPATAAQRAPTPEPQASQRQASRAQAPQPHEPKTSAVAATPTPEQKAQPPAATAKPDPAPRAAPIAEQWLSDREAAARAVREKELADAKPAEGKEQDHAAEPKKDAAKKAGAGKQ